MILAAPEQELQALPEVGLWSSQTAEALDAHDSWTLAERRQDWVAAERWAKQILSEDNNDIAAYINLAKAIAHQGRLGDASAIYLDLKTRFPGHHGPLLGLADVAEKRGDWATAETCWRSILEIWPDLWWNRATLASMVLKQGRLEDAQDILASATAQFPDEPSLYADAARIAELRSDWPEALRLWSAVKERVAARCDGKFPFGVDDQRIDQITDRLADHLQRLESYLRSSNNRFSAVVLNNTGFGLFPAVEQLSGLKASDFALRFESLGYNCELGFIQRACGAEPLSLTRFSGISVAEMARGLRDKFCKLCDVCNLVAERPGPDWDIRDMTYNLAYHTFQKVEEISQEEVLAKQAKRLRLVVRKFFEDIADGIKIFVVWRNSTSLSRKEIDELRLAISPHGDPPILWLVPAAGEPLGLVEEVEPKLMRGFVERMTPPGQGTDLNYWLPILLNAFLLNEQIEKNNALQQLHSQQANSIKTPPITDSPQCNPDLHSADRPEITQLPSDRDLVMQFESLGGGGHGCEFGIFQRHFGAEPLGLLRWADIFQDHLSTALETKFAGVGDPELTNIFVPPNSTEYWTTDTRYHMAMRSFVQVADVPPDRMRQQVTKRFKYLSNKLIDDLESGSKIFVYKNMKRNLTDGELNRLHAACQSYGNNTLLYIRYADPDHPWGTVVDRSDGLLVGYIDHFSHTADTDEFIGTANDALLLICRRAYSVWRQTAEHTANETVPLPVRLTAAEDAARDGKNELLRSLLPRLVFELGNDLKPLLPIGLALVSRADFDEADAIFRTIIAKMPAYFPAFEAFGMSAFHRRDWPTTIIRWREAQSAFPNEFRPSLWLAGALHASQAFAEAEDVLRAACERFPDNQEVARDFARLPLADGRVEAAVARLAHLRERFPASVDGYAMGAEALRTLGRFEEAEALLENVGDRFQNNFQYHFQSARNATSLNRWGDAFRRWGVLLAQFPNDRGVGMALGDTIMLWHLAKAEGDASALAAELPDEIARRAGASAPDGDARSSERELFMRFEGLGDRCEFGLVQRHFGAEPISLLRWSGIEPKQLISALECRFDGVGDLENTFVQLNENSNEYFAGDNRFFYMHTFIKKNEGAEAELFEKIRKRMLYLKRKLLTDLEAGEKIFVYKVHLGDLTDAEAIAISEVFARHYPASRLVLMNVARDPNQIGTVAPLAGNAVRAFLSRFSENLESRFIRFDEWQTALAAALRYFAARS